jgi:hypothetical protein
MVVLFLRHTVTRRLTGLLFCAIIHTYTKKGAVMKDAILAKLAEVEAMLLTATCDGEKLVELECVKEVENAFSTLAQTVDYYVD